MLPFLISLSLVYLLFGLLKVRTQEAGVGSVLYWLEFGLKRILLFANSVLAFQLFFSWFGFDDLLHLPLKISTMKYVILGKILFANAFNSYSDIRFHRASSSEQTAKPDWRIDSGSSLLSAGPTSHPLAGIKAAGTADRQSPGLLPRTE